MAREETETAPAAPVAMLISREMVALMKDYLGRGPTAARTYVQDDLVACVMRDTMTPAERFLSSNGNRREIREIRRTLQDSYRPAAIATVERLVGRKVATTISDHDIEADYAVEIFLLEPDDGELVQKGLG